MASSQLDRQRSRSAKMNRALTAAEWWRLGLMFAVIVALHLVGWLTVTLLVEPARLSRRQGIRHRRRADGVHAGLTARVRRRPHRRHRQHHPQADERRTPTPCRRVLLSLGHSTVVFGLAVMLVTGLKAIVGPVENDSSTLHHYTGLIGTSISGAFLYLIGILNVIVLVGIVRVFAHLRRGDYDEAELEQQLDNRGLLIRFLGRFTKSLTKSWHMYPVGFCSVSGSTPPPRSRCWCWREPVPQPACPGMPSCACPSCSPPACVCWTPSTVRS